MAKGIKNVKFKNYRLFEENGGLYLSLVYSYEAEDGEHELYMPQIRLSIYGDRLPTCEVEQYTLNINPNVYANFGAHQFGLVRTDVVLPDKYGEKHVVNAYYADCLVKEKKVEMTLEEIEKKLGHKIKIVSDKEG